MWQELRNELHPRGLEIVTVAVDAAEVAAAGRWIAKAEPQHPALIVQRLGQREMRGGRGLVERPRTAAPEDLVGR